jgi:hypothetical protein
MQNNNYQWDKTATYRVDPDRRAKQKQRADGEAQGDEQPLLLFKVVAQQDTRIDLLLFIRLREA